MKFIFIVTSLVLSVSSLAQEVISLRPWEQTRIEVEGCPFAHGGILKLERDIVSANCAPKICIANAWGFAGRNQKISKVEILDPINEIIEVKLQGNDKIVEYVKSLIAQGTCYKARINWLNGYTDL